mgnify:CR=1 FL=1
MQQPAPGEATQPFIMTLLMNPSTQAIKHFIALRVWV